MCEYSPDICLQTHQYCIDLVFYLLLQNAGLNDSANWPSLNKATDKDKVIVVVAAFNNLFSKKAQPSGV